MKDPIERQDAIDTVFKFLGKREIARTIQTALWILPSAQPDPDMIHLQKEQAYMQGYEEGQKTQYRSCGTWDAKKVPTTQPDKIEVHLQEPHALMIKELIVKETTYSMATKQETVGELIRCKDCEHWERESICDGYCDEIEKGGFDEDHFCSYAERREE